METVIHKKSSVGLTRLTHERPNLRDIPAEFLFRDEIELPLPNQRKERDYKFVVEKEL